ncbi:MAG: 50S ribosomal protein L4 [Dissulfurimicrobium sp.]|uniref:50S ribosomal protein L4 n=1 Tax=Dissulfurimicrobium TaxID=1769732 RepID=UPI001EDBB63D|nr:50S ribosomal protein L4 [Dissulfurimicrobium hydrothermale]UKL14321.1 50S ribosomal protein L4 [Dissulfurimicrobium hydrothermale]
MATLAVYDSQRQKISDIEVSDQIFNITPKEGVLHEVVKWQLAKRRSGNASTKERSEVSGGGKKPWRQKGTGRARAGSNTSPLWRRGGAVFGPKPRSYFYNIPKKLRRLALRMALSAKRLEDNLYVVRDFGLERIKTKDFSGFLKRFDVNKAIIVIDGEDRMLELSARNIPNIKILSQEALNVFDLLKYRHLILKESAVGLIEERLQP